MMTIVDAIDLKDALDKLSAEDFTNHSVYDSLTSDKIRAGIKTEISELANMLSLDGGKTVLQAKIQNIDDLEMNSAINKFVNITEELIEILCYRVENIFKLFDQFSKFNTES